MAKVLTARCLKRMFQTLVLIVLNAMSQIDSLTIEKILTTAEEHFAVHGYFATSMRQLTREAEVNVAAVHYHFGSKDSLFLAVLKRRIAPFVTMVLDNMQQKSEQKKSVQAEDLVQAFVDVCLFYAREYEREAVLVTRLVSRLMLDEYKTFREQLAQEYVDVIEKTLHWFEQALPHLDKETVRWRMHIALSTLFNSFAGNDVLKALARREWVNAKNPEQVARFVVPFVVAGLTAP